MTKIKYFNQKKAWSDTATFMKWWDFFRDYISKRTTKQVILLMDNCGPHGAELSDPTGQIIVLFLPPGVTSVFQPMDCGVIAMLKKNYRYSLLMRMLHVWDRRESLRRASENKTSGTKGLSDGHAPNLKDAMEILYEV